MKSVVIIGFGRFGELLASILKENFAVSVCEVSSIRQAAARKAGIATVNLADIGRFDWVIFAVPISLFESIVEQAAANIHKGQLVMDISSVKVHPARVMLKHLGYCEIIATHPMFGPDSASRGLQGLQMALCPVTAHPETVESVMNFWASLGVNAKITSPEDHDKDAAYTLAFTHAMAKIVLGVNGHKVSLTTRSYDAIQEVARLCAKDTDQLFHDMLYYNPYFKHMQDELLISVRSTMHRLGQIAREQEETGIFALETANVDAWTLQQDR